VKRKRSALFHLHARAGASFLDHLGWEIPASFSPPEAEAVAVRNGAGLADLSYRAKFDSTTQPQHLWWRLGSRRYLTIGDPPFEPPLNATDVTSVFANLILAGPQARDVLSKLTSLRMSEDCLPDLSCGQAAVAHTHAIVLREDLRRLPAYHILISREYSESVWEAIMHAGREFHVRPFGLKALELLRI
jgi:glycine cleavage system aminomethyltransferase T